MSVASELGVVVGRSSVPFPVRLGYQTLAVVREVGEGVTLRRGQRVVAMYGHASAAVMSAARCLPVPNHVPDLVALAAVLGEETHKGVRKIAPKPHEHALVSGAGLIGLLTTFNLVRRGHQRVTVVDPDAGRRALASALGVRALHPSDLSDLGAFAQVGFECSASPDGFTGLLEALTPGGRACVLSDGNWGALTLSPTFHERELWVVGSSDGEDYAGYARWLWLHADPWLEGLFAEVVTPAALPGTYRRLEDWPRPVSVVVDWTRGLPPQDAAVFRLGE
ncbi:zinc-dependent alcohol dehydrogenase [Deinococcus aquiradiocola]|uniref:zinc-dependent alcohol dehydrogenase n=1 Tax=Deinococcus aquiradiocola TaxID=393059 RepID=UPI001E43EDF7|nr:zinc-binding alcohol dehydrogenase [Deinococcus aquiradiocola]